MRRVAVAGSRRLGAAFDAAVRREWERGHHPRAVGGRDLTGDVAGDGTPFGRHALRELLAADELLVVLRPGEEPGETVSSEIALARELGLPVRVEAPPEEDG